MKGVRMLSKILVAAIAACISLNASVGAAQAYTYPSLQLPTVSNRDFTAALSVAKGTVAVFQWREGLSDDMHFSLDAGLGDPEGRNNDLVVFGGGGLGFQLLRATADQPLDVLLTGGAGLALGAGQTVVRIPVGASAGHRFGFEGGVALTPYVHPRLSIDRCFSCNGSTANSTEVSLNFDIGLNFEVTPRFALRAAAAFSGSDVVSRNDTFAFGINWIPVPLVRK
ncbi:MAG: hypothetical protein ABJB74_19625 [Gemmatimonas sp.]